MSIYTLNKIIHFKKLYFMSENLYIILPNENHVPETEIVAQNLSYPHELGSF